MKEKIVNEKFVNKYPFYTKHTMECENIKATYQTYFFGIVNTSKYIDPEIEAKNICIFEPIRWLDHKRQGKKYIDSLDELIKEIHENKNNIKKVKFTW